MVEINKYNIFIGKYCKIVLVFPEHTYVYSGHIVDYDSETITFVDKFGKPYTYSSKYIIEIKPNDRELEGSKNG